VGLLGIDLIGQKHECASPHVTCQAWQEPGAAGIGDQPDFRKCLQEACRFGGEHNIARQGNAHASASRNSIDRRDHWLGHGPDQVDQRVVGFAQGRAKIHLHICLWHLHATEIRALLKTPGPRQSPQRNAPCRIRRRPARDERASLSSALR
jgi:hypothetical protein